MVVATTVLVLLGGAHAWAASSQHGMQAAAAASQPPPKHGRPLRARTGGTSNVTSHSATVHGRIALDGPPTTYYFQYGKTIHYGHRTPSYSAGSGFNTRSVKQRLSGLSQNTVYHYRIIARDQSGTSFGRDRTFKTAAVAPAFTG